MKTDPQRSKAFIRLRIAAVVVGLVVLYVMVYALLDFRSKSLSQVTSALLLGSYIGITLLISDATGKIAAALHALTALTAAVGFAIAWGFDLPKGLLIASILLALSFTSKWWLRAI